MPTSEGLRRDTRSYVRAARVVDLENAEAELTEHGLLIRLFDTRISNTYVPREAALALAHEILEAFDPDPTPV